MQRTDTGGVFVLGVFSGAASASTTKGGITIWDRLFGGGGDPMSTVTEKAIDDLLDKLFE